jgi:hypothetical protein
MSTMKLAAFQGVDSSSGPTVISGVNAAPGDKIISVTTLSSLPDSNDYANFFIPAFSTEIVQISGNNWTTKTFIALIQSA